MRCDGVGPDSASPQPVMARASSLRTAISQRDRSTDVTSGHGAPASTTMIALVAFHDPAAARVDNEKWDFVGADTDQGSPCSSQLYTAP